MLGTHSNPPNRATLATHSKARRSSNLAYSLRDGLTVELPLPSTLRTPPHRALTLRGPRGRFEDCLRALRGSPLSAPPLMSPTGAFETAAGYLSLADSRTWGTSGQGGLRTLGWRKTKGFGDLPGEFFGFPMFQREDARAFSIERVELLLFEGRAGRQRSYMPVDMRVGVLNDRPRPAGCVT